MIRANFKRWKDKVGEDVEGFSVGGMLTGRDVTAQDLLHHRLLYTPSISLLLRDIPFEEYKFCWVVVCRVLFCRGRCGLG